MFLSPPKIKDKAFNLLELNGGELSEDASDLGLWWTFFFESGGGVVLDVALECAR